MKINWTKIKSTYKTVNDRYQLPEDIGTDLYYSGLISEN